MSANGNRVCGFGNPHGQSGSLPLECEQNCLGCEIKRPKCPKQDPKPFPTGRHFRITFWDSLSKGMVQHAVLRNMVSRKFWRFHPVIGDNREVFRLFRNIGSGYAQASANFIRNPPKIIRDGASNFRLRTGSGKCPNSDRQSSKTVHSNFSQNHLGNCAVIR